MRRVEMISSRFINEMFNALAVFTTRLTGKDIQFDQIEPGQEMEAASENMSKFSKDVTDAFSNSEVKMLGGLEPGKLYCLQVEGNANWDQLENLAEGLKEQNILLAIIDKSMNFVSIPEGYEIVRKENT